MDRGDRNKSISLSNSLENLLFPPGKYNAAQLINLTPFFTGNITIDKYKQLMVKLFELPNEERLWWVIKAEYGQVTGKIVCIVLLLQLIGKEKRDIGGYNQASKNVGTAAHQLTSPRNKSNRSLYISNEQILLQNFIKQNLQTFLRILSSEQTTNEDPFLTTQQIQPLGMLFKLEKNKSFSSMLPIFLNTQKLKASTIAEHLAPRIVISEQELISLEGLSLSVTIKDEAQCAGKDLKIIGCYDSQIFVDSSVRSLYVVGCGNCNIYVGACEKIAFIDKCEKISLTIASSLLRVCNTMDSTIYSYSVSPIIMTGENRSLGLGPNNSSSIDLKGHLKQANIPITAQYMSQFKKVLCKAESNTLQIIKPADFDILVLPAKAEDQKQSNNSYLLAPEEYIKQLEQRNSYCLTIKANIIKSNLSADNSKHLHSAIQGHFKQWLENKKYDKNLIGIVKMIDRR